MSQNLSSAAVVIVGLRANNHWASFMKSLNYKVQVIQVWVVFSIMLVNAACWVIFHAFWLTFSKHSFRITIRVSSILDPDQRSSDSRWKKVAASRQRVTDELFHIVCYNDTGVVHCTCQGVNRKKHSGSVVECSTWCWGRLGASCCVLKAWHFILCLALVLNHKHILALNMLNIWSRCFKSMLWPDASSKRTSPDIRKCQVNWICRCNKNFCHSKIWLHFPPIFLHNSTPRLLVLSVTPWNTRCHFQVWGFLKT